MLEIFDFEQYLSQNGKFCLLDWLVAQNLLSYSDYEAWRYGHLKILDKHIGIDKVELFALFETTVKHGEALDLSPFSQQYFSWQEANDLTLSASDDKNTHVSLTQQWLRSQDQPQLDLFMDNTAAIAQNKLFNALGDRQWQQAKQHLDHLSKHNPNHQALGQYLDLVNYGEHMQANKKITSDTITAELQGLQQEVLPLAKELLGDTSRDYLAYAWRRIADNLQTVAFTSEQPDLHRSYALRQVPDWSAIQQDLNEDPQLYQFPQLLEHLATSYSMLKQPEKSVLLWCHIFEKFPDYAEVVMDQNTEQNKEQLLYSLWHQFWEINDSWSIAVFPAFLLLKHPGLIHVLTAFKPLEHAATRAMANLLHCHQMNEDEIPARQQLQEICPSLQQLYLKRCN